MRRAVLSGFMVAFSSSSAAFAAVSRPPTAVECERAAAGIPSGDDVYRASKEEFPDGRCYVNVTFFGDRNLQRYVKSRVAEGQTPDKVLLPADGGEVAVQLRLATPTTVYPALLDEDGKVVPDDQSPEECEKVRSEIAAALTGVAGLAPTLTTQQGLGGGYWGDHSSDHCYVDVLFGSAAELALFVDWRIETLGTNVERVTFYRPFGDSPYGPQIQVPLLLRTR